jgi:hypothetical protein
MLSKSQHARSNRPQPGPGGRDLAAGRAGFERNRNLSGMNGFGNAQKVVADVRRLLRLGGHGSTSLKRPAAAYKGAC